MSEAISNRPGLDAIEYRTGTHAGVLASLLAGLSAADRPALRRLGTREPDDFTVAFLDATATVAELVSFYGERIVNESYLRTAGERLSVVQLARAIGYELDPGVAAEAALAFQLEEAEGAPQAVTIEVGTKVQSVPGPGERPQSFETVEAIEARPQWNELRPRLTEPRPPRIGDTEAFVRGLSTNLAPGDPILIVGDERAEEPQREEWDFRILDAVEPDAERGVTRLAWRPGLGKRRRRTGDRVPPAQRAPRLYALRLAASLFGASAPEWKTFAEAAGGEPKAGADWPGMAIKGIGEITDEGGVVQLEGVHRGILAQPDRDSRPESWLVLSAGAERELYRVTRAEESARQRFALALKTTLVGLEGENLKHFDGRVRDAVAYAQSEPLELAEAPSADPVGGGSVVLGGPIPELPAGRTIALSGRRSDAAADAPPETELATVAHCDGAPPFARIELREKLGGTYVRDTVRIAANVAAAGHGESTSEPIGSGDATAAFQRLPLRGSPLTHVYAAGASGRRSTLELRVDGLRWSEVPSLFGRGPGERVYAIRRDETGATTVELGDGRNGARLPSGQENVVASYRTGLGREGSVGPGKLTQLTARPLGVRGVSNPLPASGGADPERLEDARANAPLELMTLGRIVSLGDYEDFARAFEGVAKAHATWVWGPGGRAVLLTVAAVDGKPLPAEGPLRRSLLAAIGAAGDPDLGLRLRSFEPVPFQVAAKIGLDPTAEPRSVLAAAEARLRERFAFAAMDFGQVVSLSQVVAALHSVPGVVAVDVNALHAGLGEPSLQKRLAASLPLPGDDADAAAPAQILCLQLRPGDLGTIA